MLSVLIPTYNYNVFPLVKEIHKQCEECGIEYEIIVIEDHPENNFTQNQQINLLANCKFSVNSSNLGRASNLNKLVGNSKFDYILILEADAFPKNNNYISSFIKLLDKNPQAVFGGVIYADEKPLNKAVLRWKYGHQRESKNIEYRLKNPSDIVFSWNLLLKKSVFLLPLFDASIHNYGFEDLVFLKNVKKQNIPILQIDNPLIHQNQEESIIFLQKTKTGLKTLKDLYLQNLLNTEDSKLLKAYKKLSDWKLSYLFSKTFEIIESKMTQNLISKNPSLFIFDLFRLGFFCQQMHQKS